MEVLIEIKEVDELGSSRSQVSENETIVNVTIAGLSTKEQLKQAAKAVEAAMYAFNQS